MFHKNGLSLQHHDPPSAHIDDAPTTQQKVIVASQLSCWGHIVWQTQIMAMLAPPNVNSLPAPPPTLTTSLALSPMEIFSLEKLLLQQWRKWRWQWLFVGEQGQVFKESYVWGTNIFLWRIIFVLWVVICDGSWSVFYVYLLCLQCFWCCQKKYHVCTGGCRIRHDWASQHIFNTQLKEKYMSVVRHQHVFWQFTDTTDLSQHVGDMSPTFFY